MNALDLIRTLGQSLPDWTFQPYGQQGAVACYPPTPPNAESFASLNALAPISSVCGPLYVVTTLRNKPSLTVAYPLGRWNDGKPMRPRSSENGPWSGKGDR